MCALDIKYDRIGDFPIKVLSPYDLAGVGEYDYIIITISDENVQREAKVLLLGLGIPLEKIVI